MRPCGHLPTFIANGAIGAAGPPSVAKHRYVLVAATYAFILSPFSFLATAMGRDFPTHLHCNLYTSMKYTA